MVFKNLPPATPQGSTVGIARAPLSAIPCSIAITSAHNDWRVE